MIEIQKVHDNAGNTIGVEFKVKHGDFDEDYFIDVDQTNGLQGVRLGKFTPGLRQTFVYEKILKMRTF